MHNFGCLATETNQRLLTLRERNSKFILDNPNCLAVLKIHVDPDLCIQGKKCDWLLIEVASWLSMFIELKGRNINDAIEQLNNSIKKISNPLNGYIVQVFNNILAFIIASRIPLIGTDIQNAKIKFKKKYKATLIFKSRLYRHTI